MGHAIIRGRDQLIGPMGYAHSLNDVNVRRVVGIQ